MDASNLKPRDRVKLSGTGSEGVVQAVKGNAVTVKLAMARSQPRLIRSS
jgi:hypothetical protein